MNNGRTNGAARHPCYDTRRVGYRDEVHLRIPWVQFQSPPTGAQRGCMAVVSISSLPKDREAELEPVAEIAISLSGRLTRLRVNEIGPAVAAALKQIAEVIGVDSCRLMQFTDGSLAPAPLSGEAGLHTEERVDASVDGWLIERLGRGYIVASSRPEDLPVHARAARAHARRTGVCSVLGVPAWIAGQVVCGLVIDNLQSPRRWRQPMIERLQL